MDPMQPLAVEQVDVLVHPNWEDEAHFHRREATWRKTIEEIAENPSRVLVIILSAGIKGRFAGSTREDYREMLGRRTKPLPDGKGVINWSKQAVELVQLALEKIGRRRLVVIHHGFRRGGRRKLADIFRRRELIVSPKTRMEAYGIWTRECVRTRGNSAMIALKIQRKNFAINEGKSIEASAVERQNLQRRSRRGP